MAELNSDSADKHSAVEAGSISMARQIASAASAFELQRLGHAPQSVTVVLSGETLVITLHGSLSPAELAMAKSLAGAAQVQEFHRQLFASAAVAMREEIERITGIKVRDSKTEVGATSGTVVQVFTTGTMVQVFLLAHSVADGSWTQVCGDAASAETKV
jgi:uncharacterized protein YbcI